MARHDRERASSRSSFRKIAFPLLGLAVVTVVIAIVLDRTAKRHAEEARAARAARIAFEHAFLVGERERLLARTALLDKLGGSLPREVPEERMPAEPLDPEPRYGPNGKNTLFVWLSRGRSPQAMVDDRVKLASLLARAEAPSPPDAPWGAALEQDLEHVLSRYVVVAEVIEKVEAGSTSLDARIQTLRRKDYSAMRSFEGGACLVALRVVDSSTGETVAAGGTIAASSEEITVEYSLQPGGRSISSQVEEAAARDLERRIAEAVGARLAELVGGAWDLR